MPSPRWHPYLRVPLDQLIHVPFDRVQVLLDVVEVLNGLVGSDAAGVALVLGRADLLQGLVKGGSAGTKRGQVLTNSLNASAAFPRRTEMIEAVLISNKYL